MPARRDKGETGWFIMEDFYVRRLWSYGVMGLWGYGVMGLWGYEVIGLWGYEVMGLWGFVHENYETHQSDRRPGVFKVPCLEI